VLNLNTAAADNPRSTQGEQSRVLNPPEPTAADFIPVDVLCKRTGCGVRNYSFLVAKGQAPAPVRGVPRQAALAWLRSRGITTEPPGELIRIPVMCELAGWTIVDYGVAVYRSKAPRQVKGVPKGPATAWMRAWVGLAAAKENLRAVTSQSSAHPEGSAHGL
jgi:hypothetical protein